MAIVNLLPDAEGTTQQWIPFPVRVPVVHWNKVDDPVGSPDEDVTYVSTDLTNQIEEFNHETSDLLTGAKIDNVRLLARCRKTNALDTMAVDLGLLILGTRYSAGVSFLVITSYADYTADWAANPAPGSSNFWTKADIDSLQSSIHSVFGVTSGQLRCTQVYLIVTYTPAPPPKPRPPRSTATVDTPAII